MKKNYFKLAAFAAIMTMSMAGMTSCSDNENLSEASPAAVINDQLNEVSINRLGGYIDVPVMANGNWTAEVKSNTKHAWACVTMKEGSGATRLQVIVDPLSPRLQIQERSAEIIIKSDEGEKVVRLRQYVGLKPGETAANDDSEVFYDVWFSKGLGAGFDPITGTQTGSMILNMQGIQKLATENPTLYRGLVRQTSNVNARDEVELVDKLENNEVQRKASSHLDVQ